MFSEMLKKEVWRKKLEAAGFKPEEPEEPEKKPEPSSGGKRVLPYPPGHVGNMVYHGPDICGGCGCQPAGCSCSNTP